jgi:hypothetical protein
MFHSNEAAFPPKTTPITFSHSHHQKRPHQLMKIFCLLCCVFNGAHANLRVARRMLLLLFFFFCCGLLGKVCLSLRGIMWWERMGRRGTRLEGFLAAAGRLVNQPKSSSDGAEVNIQILFLNEAGWGDEQKQMDGMQIGQKPIIIVIISAHKTIQSRRRLPIHSNYRPFALSSFKNSSHPFNFPSFFTFLIPSQKSQPVTLPAAAI